MQVENSEYDHLVNYTFKHPIGSPRERAYTVEDIDWIGTRDELVDTEQFLSFLKEIRVDEPNSFDQSYLGWNIVMKDGCWYEGDVDWEYGACLWQFHEPPHKPDTMFNITCKEDILGESDEYESE